MFDPGGEGIEHSDKAVNLIQTEYGLASIVRGGQYPI
jgi:hypothetical protein